MENFTEQEIAEIDLTLGKDFVNNAIALARRLYTSPERQARELRYWYEVARGFPCHAPYSMPLLATEINQLEDQVMRGVQ